MLGQGSGHQSVFSHEYLLFIKKLLLTHWYQPTSFPKLIKNLNVPMKYSFHTILSIRILQSASLWPSEKRQQEKRRLQELRGFLCFFSSFFWWVGFFDWLVSSFGDFFFRNFLNAINGFVSHLFVLKRAINCESFYIWLLQFECSLNCDIYYSSVNDINCCALG